MLIPTLKSIQDDGQIVVDFTPESGSTVVVPDDRKTQVWKPQTKIDPQDPDASIEALGVEIAQYAMAFESGLQHEQVLADPSADPTSVLSNKDVVLEALANRAIDVEATLATLQPPPPIVESSADQPGEVREEIQPEALG